VNGQGATDADVTFLVLGASVEAVHHKQPAVLEATVSWIKRHMEDEPTSTVSGVMHALVQFARVYRPCLLTCLQEFLPTQDEYKEIIGNTASHSRTVNKSLDCLRDRMKQLWLRPPQRESRVIDVIAHRRHPVTHPFFTTRLFPLHRRTVPGLQQRGLASYGLRRKMRWCLQPSHKEPASKIFTSRAGLPVRSNSKHAN
jgi:hypothetical protein